MWSACWLKPDVDQSVSTCIQKAFIVFMAFKQNTILFVKLITGFYFIKLILNRTLSTAVWYGVIRQTVNINKINKLQRRACKLILSQEYNGLKEALKRLNILSSDQIVFLNKAKIMYKVRKNLAPSYLQELFQMRDVNLNNTALNLRSVR